MIVSDRWLTGVTTVFLLACLTFFMLYPVYDICKTELLPGWVFHPQKLCRVLYQSADFSFLTNSLYVSVVTMVITTVAAFFFAYGLTRTTIRGKGMFYLISNLSPDSPFHYPGAGVDPSLRQKRSDHPLPSPHQLEYLRGDGDHCRRVSLLFSECPVHSLHDPLGRGYPPG